MKHVKNKYLMESDNRSRPQFRIYRKEHFPGVSIHGTSLHHPVHKNATIMSAIHRLISLLLSRDVFEEEITQIEHIALLNKLEVDVREIVRRKTLRKLLLQKLNLSPPSRNQSPS